MAKIIPGEGLRAFRRYDLPKHMANDPKFSPAAKLVWMCLADMAFSSGSVFLGIDEIGRRMGIPSRSVRRAISELSAEKSGWLTVEQRAGKTSLYVPDIPPDPGQIGRTTPAKLDGLPRPNWPTSPCKESVQGSNTSPPAPGVSAKGDEKPPRYSPKNLIDAFSEALWNLGRLERGKFYRPIPADHGAWKSRACMDEIQNPAAFFRRAIQSLERAGLNVSIRACMNLVGRADLAGPPTGDSPNETAPPPVVYGTTLRALGESIGSLGDAQRILYAAGIDRIEDQRDETWTPSYAPRLIAIYEQCTRFDPETRERHPVFLELAEAEKIVRGASAD